MSNTGWALTSSPAVSHRPRTSSTGPTRPSTTPVTIRHLSRSMPDPTSRPGGIFQSRDRVHRECTPDALRVHSEVRA